MWRRHTHLAEGHRAGKGCVRDGVSRGCEAWVHRRSRRPPQNRAEEAVVCGGMLPAGARAGTSPPGGRWGAWEPCEGVLGALCRRYASTVDGLLGSKKKKKKNFFGSADLSKRLLFALFNVLLQDNLQNLAGHQDQCRQRDQTNKPVSRRGVQRGPKPDFLAKVILFENEPTAPAEPRHTPHGGSEKTDTEKGTRGQGLGVGSGTATVATDRSMCALYRPQGPPLLPPSRPLPPSLSPPDPRPKARIST